MVTCYKGFITDNYLRKREMAVSDQLRERRLERKMTQQQVAKAASMNMTQYNGYERGRSVPSPSTLARIATALQTTPEELLGRVSAVSANGEIHETVGAHLQHLRNQFRSQIAAELGLPTDEISVRIEIH